jgi:YidC/Oxa1 family membrane protein insertase
VVKLIMLPFQWKSKKSMMRTSRMTPRLKELEKKFGNDQQRYQQEMNKLYKEEGVNPMSGCLWSFLPFPILIALYQAIRYPLTIMMGVAEDLLADGGAITTKLAELGYDLANYSTGRNATVYEQIFQSQFITEHFDQFAGISDKLQALSYKFLGMNLGGVPKLAFWNWDWSSASAWLPELGLFLIPAIAALLSYYSMKVSNAANPQTKDQQQQTQSMMLMMPLISLWICFTMPGVMGIYWIAQSVFAIVQDVVLTKRFNRELDIEDADRIEREKAREAELEAKRLETERLKAEGITLENKNTSKKKKQAVAAQKEAERKAAEVRAAKAAKRGGKGEDIPASQVGNRRYARGRAYVADRYSNPDEAEEKTLAAALESQEYDEEVTEAVAETEEEAVNAEVLLEENEAPEEAEEDAVAEAAEDAEETEEIEEIEETEETETSEGTNEVDLAQEDEQPSEDRD